jgi:hypothetical protein
MTGVRIDWSYFGCPNDEPYPVREVPALAGYLFDPTYDLPDTRELSGGF